MTATLLSAGPLVTGGLEKGGEGRFSCSLSPTLEQSIPWRCHLKRMHNPDKNKGCKNRAMTNTLAKY
jgi:hypothetical protein